MKKKSKNKLVKEFHKKEFEYLIEPEDMAMQGD